MVMSLPLVKRSTKRQRQQPISLWLHKHDEKQKVVVDYQNNRRWDEMDHEILVGIMKRLPWRDLYRHVCYVCKSWLSALLDSIFPPGNVLDLRPLDLIPRLSIYYRMRFCDYMKLVLDRCPSTQYTEVYFPSYPIKAMAFEYIGQRLTSLKCVIVPTVGNSCYYNFGKLLTYCPNLERVHCWTSTMGELATHCKKIHELELYGQLGNYEASIIAQNFPELKSLSLSSCLLSVDALSIILDGQKNLIYLDTRHCFCLEDENVRSLCIPRKNNMFKKAEWNEDEINKKTASIKKHLQCARKYCSKCSYAY